MERVLLNGIYIQYRGFFSKRDEIFTYLTPGPKGSVTKNVGDFKIFLYFGDRNKKILVGNAKTPRI